jgi:putative FmdB family regulatory protein
MPLYDYRCATCGTVAEEYRRMDDRHQPKACACGGEAEFCFSPPHVVSDIEPYQSMADGSMITSRSQHRDHLKRHNVIEVGNERLNMKREVTIPRASIRSEIKRTVDRMKQEGTFRVR